MTATDAQIYWMSSKIPNDQFLLYCFTDTETELTNIAEQLLQRSKSIPDLCIRVRELPLSVDYPRWVRSMPTSSNIVVHQSPTTWQCGVEHISELTTKLLDGAQSPWRLHLFGDVMGAPNFGNERAVIAVLQISHALADGGRASDIARCLFGGKPPPQIRSGREFLPFALLWTGLQAHRANQVLNRDTARGIVPPQAPDRHPTVTNEAPGPGRAIRMAVFDASALRRQGVSVTVGALTVVSVAMAAWITARDGQVPADLGAEVMIALEPDGMARNSFRNAGVDLHPHEPDLLLRAQMIGNSLAERRCRAAHPAHASSSRAMQHVPAAFMKWAVGQFDASVKPERVAGNTVLSSMMRGPADLKLGGGVARFTAGFPALSPVMGLTHGVHGLGNSVTISVLASPVVIDDIDLYEKMIRHAARKVSAALQ